ncbi:MAG TPA: hypothetical protein ENI61_06560 [Ignavibacteria bacterium]|nr:hypothetical protein [Ignavibacteria bacterium]
MCTNNTDILLNKNINFYSIEYIDESGYTVIDHKFMTEFEARDLINKFCSYGISSSIIKLSDPEM